MKFEILDAAVIVIALFMLGAFLKIQNIVFLYVFVLLVAAEIFVQVKFRNEKDVKEPESMQ